MINLAIQVLPMHTGNQQSSYEVIEMAIKIIEQSGLNYEVTPFETVIEGDYDDTMEVVKQIKDATTKWPGSSVIINMKMQANYQRNVRIEDKMNKYR